MSSQMILGEGTYGKVRMENGRAVKKFGERRSLIHEYLVGKHVSDCPWVVQIKGVSLKRKELYLKLYDCDLSVWGYRNKSYPDKCMILKQILYAMIWLGDCGLIHADLKPSNILINVNHKDEITELVLGDLGFLGPEKHAYKSTCTAQSYREEIVVSDFRHDIYSLGILCIQMFSSKRYRADDEEGYDLKDLLKLCKNNLNKKEKGIKIYGLIKKMISDDRNKRPTARKVMHSIFKETPPFIRSINSLNQETDYNDNLIDDLFKQSVKIYHVQEIDRAYSCFCRYMSKQQQSSQKYLIAHCILYIITCVYGHREYNMNSIIMNLNCTRPQIYATIRKLSKSEDFLATLFYSSSAVFE